MQFYPKNANLYNFLPKMCNFEKYGEIFSMAGEKINFFGGIFSYDYKQALQLCLCFRSSFLWSRRWVPGLGLISRKIDDLLRCFRILKSSFQLLTKVLLSHLIMSNVWVRPCALIVSYSSVYKREDAAHVRVIATAIKQKHFKGL